jgi:coiled-coil domain-containing protein 12
MSSLNSLSAASDDRKSRLANLRNLKRKLPIEEPTEEPTESVSQSAQSPPVEKEIASLHLSGRNYDAETRGAKLGFDAPPTLGLDKKTLEEQAAEIEANIKSQALEEEKADKGIDLFKLQPKKPNWDLKRDLETKLAVLNVRTDNAIAKLVRERIKSSQSAPNAGATPPHAKGDYEAGGMDGIALVEGLRVKEQENEEDERRARQEEEEALGL